jgi:urease accessory protein
MPDAAGGLTYGLGFMLATALLHIVGIGLGPAAGRIGERYGAVAYRAVGRVVAVAGPGMLTGVI